MAVHQDLKRDETIVNVTQGNAMGWSNLHPSAMREDHAELEST